MRLILLMADGAVRFPGLKVGVEHLMEGIEIFGIHISFFGMLVALSLFLGLVIAEGLARKTEQNTEDYLDLGIRVIVGGVISARVTYIISHWSYYKFQPQEMFSLTQGGMSFLGALSAGLLISFVYCRKRKISWLKTCDTALIGVVAAQIIGRAGDFFSRSTLGTYSDGALAMQVAIEDVDMQPMVMSRASSKMFVGNFIQVHPVFLYEIILLLLLYAVMAVVHKKQKMNGLVLAFYLIGYGMIRFATEFIRLDSVRAIGGVLSLEHLVALLIAGFGVWVLIDCLKRQRTELKNLPKHFFS